MTDGFQITPFVHFNFLWTPEFDRKEYKEDKGYNPYFFSTGFGMNIMTESISVELLYNAYVKKNYYDIGSEFSINFGLD